MKKVFLPVLLLCAPLVAAEESVLLRPLEEQSSNLVVSMGPAVVLGEQKTRPGIALELAGKISKTEPIYAGMQWGTFFETNGQFTALFALLPSLFTTLDASETVHPLLGVSVGTVISTGSESDVRLAALFKPGVRFDLSDSISLNFQSTFGLLGTNFAFIPTLATVFSI